MLPLSSSRLKSLTGQSGRKYWMHSNIHSLIFPLVYRHMATWKKDYITQPPLQLGVTM